MPTDNESTKAGEVARALTSLAVWALSFAGPVMLLGFGISTVENVTPAHDLAMAVAVGAACVSGPMVWFAFRPRSVSGLRASAGVGVIIAVGLFFASLLS